MQLSFIFFSLSVITIEYLDNILIEYNVEKFVCKNKNHIFVIQML